MNIQLVAYKCLSVKITSVLIANSSTRCGSLSDRALIRIAPKGVWTIVASGAYVTCVLAQDTVCSGPDAFGLAISATVTEHGRRVRDTNRLCFVVAGGGPGRAWVTEIVARTIGPSRTAIAACSAALINSAEESSVATCTTVTISGCEGNACRHPWRRGALRRTRVAIAALATRTEETCRAGKCLQTKAVISWSR
jgi:hypothetical protein